MAGDSFYGNAGSLSLSDTVNNLLLGFIDLYQSYLSGRYMFRNVRCTFQEESCSNYGKRIIQERGLSGVPNILGRLRRCRDYSTYLLPEGRLGWGQGLQNIVDNADETSVASLVSHLKDSGENESTIGTILQAAQMVYTYVHEESSKPIQKQIGELEIGTVNLDIKRYSSKHRLKERLLHASAYALSIELIGSLIPVSQQVIHGIVLLYLVKTGYNHFSRKPLELK